MLGRQPIVRREDDRAEPRREADAAVVRVGPCATANAEATAMDVQDDGEAARSHSAEIFRLGFVHAQMEV